MSILKGLQTGVLHQTETDRLQALSTNYTDLHSSTLDEKSESSEHQVKTMIEIASKAVKEKEILLAAEASEKVDLAYVIDCTGSMTFQIQNVKDNINQI